MTLEILLGLKLGSNIAPHKKDLTPYLALNDMLLCLVGELNKMKRKN